MVGGKSGLATNANALFGIKADKSWNGKIYNAKTKECYDGKTYITITAGFRAYDSWYDSIKDHSAFLCKFSRYSKLIGETDYKTACNEIQNAGYATEPNYAKTLITLIEQFNLTKYDTFKEEINMLDNTPDAWAKEAIEWAIKNGILKGDENGNYKLHDTCTRQDVLVFLSRVK